MLKRRLLIFAITVFLAGWFFFKAPYAMYRDIENAEIYRVNIVTKDENGELVFENVTDFVDKEAILTHVSGYGRARYKHGFTPYQMYEGDVEIGIMGGDWGHCFVLISAENDKCVLYTDADKGGYQIKNADELHEKLLSAIN